MDITKITPYIASLSPDARTDIAAKKWDDFMTDALYAACAADTIADMFTARCVAEDAAENDDGSGAMGQIVKTPA